MVGEQLFLAWVAMAKNERERYHFGTFLQLESETKVRLRPLLQKYGRGFVENKDSGDQIDGIVALYQDNSWPDFLATLRPVVDGALARFREIASVGPAQDQDILQSMITHEESYVHWIDKEIAGEEGALDVAISQLHYPLPVP